MYLAINYSLPAAQLVRAGQIDIDYFKTPNWEWIIEEAKQLKPVAVHFTLEAGNDSLGAADWDKVQQLSQATGTPYINLHLDARQDYYPNFAVDTTKGSEIETVYQVLLSDIKQVVERFGPDRVILENSPYQQFPGNTMRLCVDPELITRLVLETGCGLLLDISHAVISASYFGMDPEEYILRLPVKHLKELHFAGIHHDPVSGKLADHLSIQEQDWHWLDWVLGNVHAGEWNSPWLLSFEYGGVGEKFQWRSNPEIIAEQIPILNEHIKILKK